MKPAETATLRRPKPTPVSAPATPSRPPGKGKAAIHSQMISAKVRAAIATSKKKSRTTRDQVRQTIAIVAGDRLAVTIEEAGRLIGVGKEAAYEMVESRRLPVIRVSAQRQLVSVAALERLLLGE